MRTFISIAVMLCITTAVLAEDKKETPKLTAKEVTDGWLMLFDGESTYGWEVKDNASVNPNGWLVVAPSQSVNLSTKASFGPGKLRVTYTTLADCQITASSSKLVLKPSEKPATELFDLLPDQPRPITITAPKEAALIIHLLLFQPVDTKPIFDGKTLDGWKLFDGNPKQKLSKFEVTKDGELHLTNGPGDLQTTGKYADFVLQLECKTNGKALNSGIFFRCIDGQYQNGYECQIHNGFKDDDRTKPSDFGTGAIYRRQAARKVVANDNEWFTLTLIANGPTFATWVNGYPTLVWTDDRAKDDNPRKGLRLGAGHLSIQGHDPTTDILFRNLRLAESKAKK